MAIASRTPAPLTPYRPIATSVFTITTPLRVDVLYRPAAARSDNVSTGFSGPPSVDPEQDGCQDRASVDGGVLVVVASPRQCLKPSDARSMT
jgi:hypothetical protein